MSRLTRRTVLALAVALVATPVLAHSTAELSELLGAPPLERADGGVHGGLEGGQPRPRVAHGGALLRDEIFLH